MVNNANEATIQPMVNAIELCTRVVSEEKEADKIIEEKMLDIMQILGISMEG